MSAPSANLHRYNAGASQCIFSSQVNFPTSLDGELVVEVYWTDGLFGLPHKMVSVTIVVGTASGSTSGAGRRLAADRRLQGSMWGTTQLKDGGGVGQYSDKVKQKLAALEAKACTEKDLEYGIGAGMEMIHHLHNFVIPGMSDGQSIGSLSDAPDWVSNPEKLFGFGTGEGGEDLADILPKSVCAGGVCKGIMPGCQKKKTNPIGIKQVVFRISRRFKWKEHVGPQLQHAIAYGLAVLPDAINVFEKEIESQIASDTTTPGMTVANYNPVLNQDAAEADAAEAAAASLGFSTAAATAADADAPADDNRGDCGRDDDAGTRAHDDDAAPADDNGGTDNGG
eukprot:CAMPEP_0183471124 /NCGR_PEP_ID=MMETSP0370-20130417/157391_1 /TAXON_ID=268820 /ORGANISM="Peridinium aciculiferum, Strain PAER-2" /LENGTH=338 /DNA_ID=CAMNT_0025663689 /DNA_START=43 /DNA_END=1055 /DNA_ORIENTATION=+